jgi:hypothetical protein
VALGFQKGIMNRPKSIIAACVLIVLYCVLSICEAVAEGVSFKEIGLNIFRAGYVLTSFFFVWSLWNRKLWARLGYTVFAFITSGPLLIFILSARYPENLDLGFTGFLIYLLYFIPVVAVAAIYLKSSGKWLRNET